MRFSVIKLDCGIQHYGWGDPDFIPALLGRDNPGREPYAELWMGAHPDLPARVEVDGHRMPLDACIREHGEMILGPHVAQTFGGRLPYLFKVLSAKTPLSIQTHPSKRAAEAGFARENAAGVALTAPERNYRDNNHKPELIAALTDFYGLRGFRPLEEIWTTLRDTPELAELPTAFEPTPDGLRAMYETFMALPQEQVDAILGPLVDRLRREHAGRPFSRDTPEYWVLNADDAYSAHGHRDRGLFSIFLLNLVHLVPGEAMFLPAGVLHAYLEGTGMELMANSNNVLRGGLTPKHVDVPELIANVTFEGGAAAVIRAARIGASAEWIYATPAREFELRRIELPMDGRHDNDETKSAEILIVVEAETDATVTIEADDTSIPMRRGDVVLVASGVAYALTTSSAATVYKATVPT